MPDSHMHVELFRCCASSPTPELLELVAAAAACMMACWGRAPARSASYANEQCVASASEALSSACLYACCTPSTAWEALCLP